MSLVILRRLKFSKAEITKITWLIHNHMTICSIPKSRRAHQVNYFLNPWFLDLMHLHYCDEHGSLPIDLSYYEGIMKTYHEFKDEKLLENHFKPELNGADIMKEFNLEPGPKIKEILNVLREAKIEGGVKTREDEIELAKKMI